MKFIAVGTTLPEKDETPRVVVCFGEDVKVYLNEDGARKIVDDILRETNYLWPVGEDV